MSILRYTRKYSWSGYTLAATQSCMNGKISAWLS